jgi:hypothetical protein
MDDAMVARCGHTYGSASLIAVLETVPTTTLILECAIECSPFEIILQNLGFLGTRESHQQDMLRSCPWFDVPATADLGRF